MHGHDQVVCQAGDGQKGGEEINNAPLHFRVVIFLGNQRTGGGEWIVVFPHLYFVYTSIPHLLGYSLSVEPKTVLRNCQ